VLGGWVGERRSGWDVERLAEGGCWKWCLGGERWSGETEDFEGERVRACGLGVGLGHGGCNGFFARRYVDQVLLF
jgi:hypothetical protein